MSDTSGRIQDYLHGYFESAESEEMVYAEDIDKLASALADEFGADLEIAARARATPLTDFVAITYRLPTDVSTFDMSVAAVLGEA